MCSEQGGVEVLPLFLGIILILSKQTNKNKAYFLLAFLVTTSYKLMIHLVSALLDTAEK